MLRYAAERRFGRTFAVDLESPDFARLAEAFRLPATSGGLDGAHLEALLSAALAKEGPSVDATKQAPESGFDVAMPSV